MAIGGGEGAQGGFINIDVTANIDPFRASLLSAHAAANAFDTSVSSKLTPSLGKSYQGLKLNAQQTQNLSYQMNDLAVQLASGASPFTAITQQGAQIVQVFASGTGVGAALKAVGKSLVSFLVNPLTLTVIAFAAVAQGAAFLWDTVVSGASKTEAILKKHADVIKTIDELWKKAKATSAGYSEAVARSVRVTAQDQINDYTKLFAEQQKLIQQTKLIPKTIADIWRGSSVTGFTFFPQTDIPVEFERALNELKRHADEGAPAFDRYKQTIEAFQEKFKDDPEIQKWGPAFKEVTAKADELIRRMAELKQKAYELANPALRTNSTANIVQFMKDTALAAFEAENEIRRFNQEAASIGAKSPAEIAAAARARLALKPPRIGETSDLRQRRIVAEVTLEYKKAEEGLAEAHRERTLALSETVIAARQDLELIGKSVGETARLTLENSLLANLRKEAAANHVGISEAEVAAIKKEAAEVGKLKQQWAELTTLRELQFEASQMGRTETERLVASTLRAQFGENWKAWADGAIANQVRFNEQLKFSKEVFRSFLGDIKSGLEEGKNVFKAFGDAVLNVIDKIVDKLLNQLVDAIFQVGNAGAGGGAGGLGGMIMNMFSGLFGGMGGSTQGVYTPGGLYHGGGVVGQTGVHKRMIPLLHQGLASDEMFAVLQKGERVTPRGGAGGSVPNFSLNLINATGEKANARQQGGPRFNGREWVMDVVLETLGSGKADKVMGRFGGRPLPVGRT